MRRIAIAICFLLAPVAAKAINCSWDTFPANINFGTYTGGKLTANSAFQFTCTPPATATMTITRGGGSSFIPRDMSTGAVGQNLDYDLYTDAADSIVWGDGTSGTQFISFVATPQGKTYNGSVFAMIPAGLSVTPGTYTDTLQITLNWGTGSITQFFTVSATVQPICSVTTTPINFGAYDPVAANAVAPLNATGTVNVFCNPGTAVTVTLDLGTHASGSTRQLLSGTTNLTYEVYRDAGRTSIWNTTNTVGGTSTSNTVAINGGFIAYGRIAAGQDVTMGSYSDILQVTVNY